MKYGLVLGKFYPLHQGHTGLIEFAKKNSDRLIILLCAKDTDTITGPERLSWLAAMYSTDAQIEIAYTDEPLPDAPASSRSVSAVWAEYLKERFPAVNIIFTSEKYGDYLAEYMQIEHKPYDFSRSRLPASGTLLRQDPYTYWDWLAPSAKMYYQRKVCIYGPESTGKSTLTRQLALHFGVSYVPEMARELLGERHVVWEDILPIAELQAKTVAAKAGQLDKLIFCDTDLITTEIYSRYYFNKVPDFPSWISQTHTYDLYLFCEIDTPWIPDPQRDLGHKRFELRTIFMNELIARKLEFHLISGSWEQRFSSACSIIDEKWFRKIR